MRIVVMETERETHNEQKCEMPIWCNDVDCGFNPDGRHGNGAKTAQSLKEKDPGRIQLKGIKIWRDLSTSPAAIWILEKLFFFFVFAGAAGVNADWTIVTEQKEHPRDPLTSIYK